VWRPCAVKQEASESYRSGVRECAVRFSRAEMCGLNSGEDKVFRDLVVVLVESVVVAPGVNYSPDSAPPEL